MEINTRQAGSVIVVEISGRFDTPSSVEASEALSQIAEGDNRKVLLNLERLEFLSSAGLRVILRTAKLLRANNGEMKLCNASGLVGEVLETSGFGDMFHVCASVSAALDAFG